MGRAVLSESSRRSETAESENRAAPRSKSERKVLLTIALITTLAPINSTMITVALPMIRNSFGADVTRVSWLVIAYLVTMASVQPIAGKLGDRWGRRKLILAGVFYFAVASVGAAVASSLPMLIFFRIQQGIAGAIAFPNGAALIREVVPPERRARSFGMIGAITSLAAATGPALGGLLTGLAGWRAIFYVNLLITIPALYLGWRTFPATRGEENRHPFDYVGAALLLLILVGTVLLSTQIRAGGNTQLLVPGALVIVVITAAFGIWEFKHHDPVVQPRFFCHRAFAATCSVVAFSNLAMYTTLLTVPMLLADRAGWTSAKLGLVLTTLTAAAVILVPLGGRLADRYGRRWPVVIGMSIGLMGTIALAISGTDVVLPVLIIGLSSIGVGLGLASAGMQTTAVESVEPRKAGVASGIFSTSRYLGSILGSSLLAILLVTGPNGVSGFGAVFTMIIIAATISVLASFGLGDRPSIAGNATSFDEHSKNENTDEQ